MTRENAKQMLPIITAWVDGADIQRRNVPGGWWEPLEINPEFGGPPENYRIKPKPREFVLENNSWSATGEGLRVGETIRVREILY